MILDEIEFKRNRLKNIKLDNISNNKKILFDVLEKNNIKEEFVVSFDGYGDSGQIEQISGLNNIILEEPIIGPKIILSTRFGPDGANFVYWGDDSNDPQMTIKDLIESLCYDCLSVKFGGWENNSGSYGDFIFSISDRKIYLDINCRGDEGAENESYEEDY